MSLLLSQSGFIDVFSKEPDQCIVPLCANKNTQVAQIVDGRIWKSTDIYPKGYIKENGCKLCKSHYIAVLQGHVPPAALRRWGNIKKVLPLHLKENNIYNRWGDQLDSYIPSDREYPKIKSLENYISEEFVYNKPWVFTFKQSGLGVVFGRNSLTSINIVNTYSSTLDVVRNCWGTFKNRLPDNILWFGIWRKEHDKEPLKIFATYDQKNQLFLGNFENEILTQKFNFQYMYHLKIASFNNETDLINTSLKLQKIANQQDHLGVIMKSFYPFHWGEFDKNVLEIGHCSFLIA